MNEDNVADIPARTPSISVVIPAYNAVQTLGTTIASAAAQTVADIEIIVVDDGSVDGTQALVRELADSDRRIRLIEQTNSGPSAARNRGIAASRASLIALLDSDDVWTSDHLRAHLDAFEVDARLGVGFSACRIVDRHLEPTGESTRTLARAVRCEDILSGNPSTTCSSLVFRRQVFEEAGPMRSDMAYAEDQEWLFRAIRTGWIVRGLNRHTVLYRTSPSGLSANVAHMRQGWLTFLAHARDLEPAIVAANEKGSSSRMNLYWARHSQRAGLPPQVSARYLYAAIMASPATVASNPTQLVAIAGGCLAPGLTKTAIAAARKLRHA